MHATSLQHLIRDSTAIGCIISMHSIGASRRCKNADMIVTIMQNPTRNQTASDATLCSGIYEYPEGTQLRIYDLITYLQALGGEEV